MIARGKQSQQEQKTGSAWERPPDLSYNILAGWCLLTIPAGGQAVARLASIRFIDTISIPHDDSERQPALIAASLLRVASYNNITSMLFCTRKPYYLGIFNITPDDH